MLSVVDAGLGPAIVTSSVVRLDGEAIGQRDYHTQQRVVSLFPTESKAHSLRPGAVVLAGQSTCLLSLAGFGEDENDWFWDLITRRLVIEIVYESLYGGANFAVTPPVFRKKRLPPGRHPRSPTRRPRPRGLAHSST
ncbi:hypothetical protein ACGF8B_28870 [Streptomyces sp. NPDC047917]|uniref:hypothetical protein n=1 Tax=Streptomyces sp. NPDC047917 TaxID=3365491 RepID=UPI003718440D